MSEGAPNQNNTNQVEGRLGYAGGDFVYTPGTETDPDKILEAAKKAVTERGGFDGLGRGNIFVNIPGVGEFSFDENSTMENLLAAKERKETLKSMLATLTPDQTEQVMEYIIKLQEAK